MQARIRYVVGLVGVIAASACGSSPESAVPEAQAAEFPGTTLIVSDTTIAATFDATGVAEPYAQATLSTKLMGTVTAVRVREGDRVGAGQVLATIDARELEARRAQVTSGIASAEAMHREALLQAERVRALYADSAAPRAHLDAVEAGLARAAAGVQAARAGEAELEAIAGYAQVRAPFAGIVTQRFVDPGAFAAPGAPLITVQDQRRLRLAVQVTPDVARGLTRGTPLEAEVEGLRVQATVESVVPSGSGSIYTLNAIVGNADGRLPSGGSATVHVPTGTRQVVLVPAQAVRTEGDLTGVTLRAGAGRITRWVRLGRRVGELVEVTSGLNAGDTLLVPERTTRGR